jgi:PAS domain-containing protein
MASKTEMIEGHGTYRVIFDAIPSPVFVVEQDVRVVDYNTAASALTAADPEFIIRRRGGEVLHCLHALETPEGCGRAPACSDCIVRNSVNKAFGGGTVVRVRARLALLRGDQVTELYLLVTTVPFESSGRQLVLLILEDISELIALRGIVPICAGCKKIRDNKEYWHQVADYFSAHLDVEFTHGLCPDCAKKFFPDE